MIPGISPAASFYAMSPYASVGRARAGAEQTEEEESSTSSAGGEKTGQAGELSKDDQRRVEELKVTDRKVRAHEAAHVAAGGSLVTSGASFEYTTGPDGQRYAVAGDVGISMSKGRTPEETLMRAQQIRAAALAPADPSAQDISVAAAATQMAAEARVELAREQAEASKGEGEDDSAATAPVKNETGGKVETGKRNADASSPSPSSSSSSSSSIADAATALGSMIARSLSPSRAGQTINLFA
ncbi:MAG: hypothetical protein LBU43_05970 [Candidatus Accumulibacter sp.]|nr:hypothetical protein [Accumulibacter sp.]